MAATWSLGVFGFCGDGGLFARHAVGNKGMPSREHGKNGLRFHSFDVRQNVCLQCHGLPLRGKGSIFKRMLGYLEPKALAPENAYNELLTMQKYLTI